MTLETWMRDLNFTGCTLTEKWPDRLVYNIGGPQNLEVHSPCSIELDGKPMLIPACVVLAGNTDYEFFDDIAGLFRYVCTKRRVHMLTKIQDRKVLKVWVNEWFTEEKNTNSTLEWNEVTPSKCHNCLFYHVACANKRNKIIEITPAGCAHGKARIRLQNPHIEEYFKNQKDLGRCIQNILTKQ